MSVTEAITHLNGNVALAGGERVILSGGTLSKASASQLENGVVTTNVAAGGDAYVQPLVNGNHYEFIADDAIAKDATVFRAANGRVSSTGTSVIGRAVGSASAPGDTVVCIFFASSGSASSSWLNNVIDQGAAGDGVAVDSASVLAAITAAPDGGTVFFHAGTYICDTSWIAPSIAKNLTFDGEEGALIIGPTDPGTDNNFVNLTAGYNLTIKNLKFRQFHGIVQLEENTVTQHETVRVDNCDIDGAYYAVYDAGGAGQNNSIERFEFTKNKVHGLTRAPKRGVVCRFVNHKHVIVKDSYFHGLSNNDISSAIWIGSASTTGGESCEITNNYIDGVACSNDDQDVHGVFVFSAVCHIANNVIKNITNNNAGQNSEGIYVKSACPVITGNYLEDAGSEAFIYFKGALSTIEKGGVISGNTIRRVSATLAPLGNRGGFGISTTNPCAITGNDIDGLLGGIYVTGVAHSTISANNISNVAGAADTLQGIYVEDSSNVIVSGNSINGIVSSSSGPVYGIRIRRSVAGTSANITLSSNTIVTGTTGSGDEMGIGLQGDTSDVINGVLMIGNFIEGFDQGVGVVAGGPNISNVVALANNFKNCGVDYESTMSTLASVKYGTYATGSGTPVGSVVPSFIGQEYLDAAGNAWFKSYGLTNADWQAL